MVMDFLSQLTPFLNGGISAFNLYVLFRIVTIEKEVAREKEFFTTFRENEQETNKELDSRLRSIEIECNKRWSTWRH